MYWGTPAADKPNQGTHTSKVIWSKRLTVLNDPHYSFHNKILLLFLYFVFVVVVLLIICFVLFVFLLNFVCFGGEVVCGDGECGGTERWVGTGCMM